MAKPILKIISWAYLSIGCPNKISKTYNAKCPPSNIGIGNKLIRPIVIDKIIIKLIKGKKPASNTIPEISAIFKGPPMSSLDPSPIIKRWRPFNVIEQISYVSFIPKYYEK